MVKKCMQIMRQLLAKKKKLFFKKKAFVLYQTLEWARAVTWCFRLFFTAIHSLVVHRDSVSNTLQEIKTNPGAKPPSCS